LGQHVLLSESGDSPKTPFFAGNAMTVLKRMELLL